MFRKKRPQFTDEGQPAERGSFLASAFGPRVARWIFAILEIVQVGVLSLAFVILIRTFLVQPFYVKGASMEPSFLDHEYLLIDEISYRFRDPTRGEIIVFRYPRNPREYFIKRIIGLPGEIVEITRGVVKVDGVQIDEPYIAYPMTGEHRVRLGPGEYFLLGDNRPSSLDSRMFGPITRDYIIGRVWLRGWPLDRVGIVPPPEYRF